MIIRKTAIIVSILLLFLIIPLSGSEIHKAAKDGDFEMVKQLLTNDPKLLDAGNQLGQTPLLMASYSGHKDIVDFLIERGAKINQADAFGATPLHMAVAGGQKDIVILLIARGADVNAKSKNGKIPLQLAFERDDPVIVAIFLQHGLQVNAVINQYGRTLLHEAVIMGKSKVVSFLLEKGAVVDTKDNTGKTPLDLALISDHKKAAELLIKKGVKAPAQLPLEVTSIANAGFLITCGQHKILLDALFSDGMGKYPVPAQTTLEDMVKAKPPFDNINLLLVTFNQEAHFNAVLTENYLKNNPDTLLLSTRQVGLDLELYGTEFSKIQQQVITITPSLKALAEVTLRGIKMKVLRLIYGGDYQNVGFIMDIEGRTICCVGDALLKNNEEIFKTLGLPQEGIDVLFISYWDFLNKETGPLIDQYIQPKHIAVVHIPIDEKDKITADLEKLKKDYPNITIFKDSLQKQVY